MLPVGVICVQTSAPLPCAHAHDEDGWHVFDLKFILRVTWNPQDQETMRELDDLRRRNALRVTCATVSERLLLRVYLLPVDSDIWRFRVIPKSSEDSKKVLEKMQVVLHLIVRDANLWARTDSADSELEYFLPRNVVRERHAPSCRIFT
jgi:hypothetical protein